MSLLTQATQAESLNLQLLHVKGVKLKTLRALQKHSYLTRAELHKHTGLRISTLCGALKRLEDEGWVRVAFDSKDEETQRMVSVYTPTVAADERFRCAGGIVYDHFFNEEAAC